MKTKLTALVLTSALFGTLTLVTAPSAKAALAIISIRPEATVTTIDKRTITLTPPTSNSPGAWSVEISNPSIATANGLTLTLLSVGSTIIRYVQAATGDYNAVSDFSRLTVNPGIPTIGGFNDLSVNLSQNIISLTPPTSTSDGVWSYESLNPAIATVSGNTVSLKDGGTVQIRASQAFTQRWTTASTTMTLTVNAPAPIIGSFSDITLSIDSVSKVQLTMPNSNSTGTWTLSSSDPSVVGLEGYTIVARKTGTATITATQSPAGGYRSASVSMKVTIQAVAPTTAVGEFKDITTELDPGATKLIPFKAPASNSPGAWVFTASNPTIASVNGFNLIATKPGTITLTATQPATGNFGAAGPIAITVRILGKQTLTAPANVTKLVGDPALKIIYPTSLSAGAWTATSSAPTIVAINNGNLQFANAGRAIITLTQAATDTYTATATTFEVLVIGTPPTIGAFSPLAVGVGEKLTTPVTPQTNSNGKWIFASSDPTIVSIVDNVITGIKPGTAIISAYQEPAGKYGQSPTVQTNITVKPAPLIGKVLNIALVVGTRQVMTNPTSQSSGSWSYTSSNPTVASISGSTISATAPGTTSVTATQAASATYSRASTTFTITVSAAPLPKATALKTKRIINVTVTNAVGKKVIVKINGVTGRVGKNTVKPGKRTVTVQVDGKLILSKVISIQ
jgi:uncharacterized protein YjdB